MEFTEHVATRRQTRHWAAPLAVAAGVATIAAGIVIWMTGNDAGTQPKPAGPSPGQRSTPTDSPTVPADVAAADAFAVFAGGEQSDVPWADNVTFYVAGQRAADLDATLAGRPDSWEGCPPGTAKYAGRDCPVSALRAVTGGDPVYEATIPRTVGCDVVTPPQGVDLASISIRPDMSHRDCFSDYVVTLYLDASDRVSAVNFVLSGP